MKRLLPLAMALVVLPLVAPPAWAEPCPSEYGQEFCDEAWPDSDGVEVDSTGTGFRRSCLSPTSTSSGSQVGYQEDCAGGAVQADPCRTAHRAHHYRNKHGRVIVSYHSAIDWCWRKGTSKINFIYKRRWAWVDQVYWEFEGHFPWETGGGQGTNRFSAFTQGKFKICIPVIGCIQHRYPWVDITVYAGGNSTRSSGG